MRKMYSTKNNSNNNVVKANIIRYRANTYSSMSTLVRRNFHTHSRALSQSYGLHSYLSKTEEKTCITKVHKTIYSPKNNRKSDALPTPPRFICTLCLCSLRKNDSNLPSRFVLCGKTVIVLTAAYSCSRTGCDFAPQLQQIFFK